jgi:hypothetical protein
MGADEARIWEWGLVHIYENLAEHKKILEVLNNFLLQDSEGMAKGFLLYVTGEEFFFNKTTIVQPDISLHFVA